MRRARDGRQMWMYCGELRKYHTAFMTKVRQKITEGINTPTMRITFWRPLPPNSWFLRRERSGGEQQARGGEARHEAEEDKENHSTGDNAAAVLRRQNAQRGEHDHHHDGPQHLRLGVSPHTITHSHAHHGGEEVALLGGTEDVAVDQLPAALLHRLDALLLALCLTPLARPYDGVVLADVARQRAKNNDAHNRLRVTRPPHAHGEEQGHEETVGEREPVRALLAALQVDVPARPVLDVALLELDRVRVDDVFGDVHHLRVRKRRWNHHATVARFRHELPVILNVVDAGRNHAHADDAVFAVTVLVICDGEGQLE